MKMNKYLDKIWNDIDTAKTFVQNRQKDKAVIGN